MTSMELQVNTGQRNFYRVAVALVLVATAFPCLGQTKTPCPPPSVSVEGGTSASTPCVGRTYSTSFNTAENPLSEGGAWSNVGLDWTPVISNGSIAYGTHHNTGYNDSYAHLSGFAPNQSIRGTVFSTGSFTENQEIELHLRWADAPHVARGYEVLIEANNRYAAIVRWNGGLGDFTILVEFGLPSVPVTGDTLEARIVGSTITVLFNNATVQTISDTTFTTGNPGIGFFSRDPSGAPNTRFAWADITATDL
jgi:hypothetical protein